MRLITITILFCVLGLKVDSGKAEISSLNNPLWKEVPGTGLKSRSRFSEPVYVNFNGTTRKGDIITYDLVNSDAGYTRRQTNCKSNQSRSIRQGFFESSSKVNFLPIEDSWSSPEDTRKKIIIKFVCKHFR